MTAGTTSQLPILLLHGLGGTAATLAPLARALETRGFFVAHPTLSEQDRLRAASDGSPLNYGLLDLHDEAMCHAESLAAGNRVPIIVGHSNSTLLVPVLAAEGLASHAILLAPVPPPSVSSGIPTWLQKLFFTASFGFGWSSGVLRFDRKRRLEPDPPPVEIAETLLPDSGCVLSDALALTRDGRFDPAQSVETPVAVIAGEQDRLVSLKTARKIAERYGAEFHAIRDGGHWFPADRRFAEATAERIKRSVTDALRRERR